MNVLILSDGCDWIVDRIADRMIEGMPDVEFIKRYYTEITHEELFRTIEFYKIDFVHHMNSDVKFLIDCFPKLKVPLLISIRSHRPPPHMLHLKGCEHLYNLHVVNEDLLDEWPTATFIPDGVFEIFDPGQFTVGYAGVNSQYKGVHLIEEACELEDVDFQPAFGGVDFVDMPMWYKSLDLYVCASVAEGTGMPVLEALAMNVPVASVDTGFARKFPSVYKIERSVDGVREAIRRFNTHTQVQDYYWENVIPQFEALYKRIINKQ